MAEEKENKTEKENKVDNDNLIDDLGIQFSKAEQAQKDVRDKGFTWDQREDMFLGNYKDSREGTKSVLSTGELTTLAIDGACRVMAQLPTGRFYNYDNKPGANILMNLLFEHYVLPNANTGGSMLIKLRMVDLYSRVFGALPVFIDWKRGDKYTGPDFIVIHPRRFRPQPGKTAIEDMDWCFIDTEVSKEWLEKRDKSFWKNIDEVIEAHKEGSGTPEEDRSPDEKGKTKTGITLRHRFTSEGNWTVYEPTSNKVLLDEKKYFTGIPIAIKHQYPKLDSIWSLSDFDRGEGPQKAIDSLARMYLDGVAMSIDPPQIMDPDQVVLSSILRQPKARWFVKGGNMNAIRSADVSPKGIQSFQHTYGILKANLMSLGASSDTSITKSVDPGFGRTPQALKMQDNKQGARDAWDSLMMEEFIKRAFGLMADMLAKKGVDEYAFQLLGDSIEKIQEKYPNENLEKLLGKEYENGKAKVDPSKIAGKYKYELEPGSTFLKKDDTGLKIFSMLKLYVDNPQIKEDLAQRGQRIDFGEAFKRVLIDQGIQDAEKIVITDENPQSMPGVGHEGATVEEEGDYPEEELQNMMTNNPANQEAYEEQAYQETL